MRAQLSKKLRIYSRLFWKKFRRSASRIVWSKASAFLLLALIVLYYPLGGALNEKIDRNADFGVIKRESSSSTLELLAALIDRETAQNIWTPNLPFLFPSYFLDNMPSFQSGIIRGVAVINKQMSRQIICPNDTKEKTYLLAANDMLDYPPNIWVFDNSLKISPSSSNQYRKARKRIRDFNRNLETTPCIWDKNAANLNIIIKAVRNDLNTSTSELEQQMHEHDSDVFDLKADDVFYYNQGKAYAYMLSLKSLSHDYKNFLVEKNLYADWTKTIKALENATELQPRMVRNAKADSTFAANHLIGLAYYIQKAQSMLYLIEGKAGK